MAAPARDLSELVNLMQWTAAIVDKALPLDPAAPEEIRADRMKLRQIAFEITAKEQIRGDYKADSQYLLSLLPGKGS